MQKLTRHWRALAVTLVAVGASTTTAIAAPSNYCDPLGGCHSSHYLKVSPGAVKVGRTTTVSGSTGGSCRAVTVYSRAFKGATRRSFAGVPALYLRAGRNGKFSTRVTIRRAVNGGRYHVGGRCGGGNFGSASLTVRR